MYENDNETLGLATYFVSSTNKWAVSSVGYFIGATNSQYTNVVSSEFANTLDSQLFQTARLSASSLRYYGLGLENGNYTVILQFAETAYDDYPTWKSHGRRVFNIYIQVHVVKNCSQLYASQIRFGYNFHQSSSVILKMRYTSFLIPNIIILLAGAVFCLLCEIE